jgi:hypothetical protein
MVRHPFLFSKNYHCGIMLDTYLIVLIFDKSCGINLKTVIEMKFFLYVLVTTVWYVPILGLTPGHFFIITRAGGFGLQFEHHGVGT